MSPQLLRQECKRLKIPYPPAAPPTFGEAKAKASSPPPPPNTPYPGNKWVPSLAKRVTLTPRGKEVERTVMKEAEEEMAEEEMPVLAKGQPKVRTLAQKLAKKRVNAAASLRRTEKMLSEAKVDEEKERISSRELATEKEEVAEKKKKELLSKKVLKDIAESLPTKATSPTFTPDPSPSPERKSSSSRRRERRSRSPRSTSSKSSSNAEEEEEEELDALKTPMDLVGQTTAVKEGDVEMAKVKLELKPMTKLEEIKVKIKKELLVMGSMLTIHGEKEELVSKLLMRSGSKLMAMGLELQEEEEKKGVDCMD